MKWICRSTSRPTIYWSRDMSDTHLGISIGDPSGGHSRLSDDERRAKNRERTAKYAALNPGKVREQNRQSKMRQRQKNPEKFADRNRRWRVKNADHLRWYEVSRKFGLDQSEYAKLFEDQKGVCAICENPETAKRNGVVRALAVDHCHDTGKVRGLLCSNCNTALGKFKDNTKVLAKAIKYLG